MPDIRMRWPSPRLVLIIIGCLVAVGVPLGWSLVDHPSGVHQVNAGAAVRLAESTAPPSRSATSRPRARVTPAPTPTTRPSSPSVTTPRRTPNPALPAGGPTTPIGLAIPAISVNAPVVPVGVDTHGEMAIPERISTVGWYQWGPGPGASQGSIVMAGHVDSARDGLGAFFRLHDVGAGNTVTVTMGDGHTRTYRVIAREEFPKTTVPLDKLFSRTGPERLTLITCGGAFDQQVRSYYDNIVITAVPA